MRVEHVAVYVRDLEASRAWYERWFGARASARYESRNQPGFTSYFLSFAGGGARIELMAHPETAQRPGASRPMGYAHLAISAGSRDAVDDLASRMLAAGVIVRAAPRETGDGYYEAVVDDPDGNAVEIVA